MLSQLPTSPMILDATQPTDAAPQADTTTATNETPNLGDRWNAALMNTYGTPSMSLVRGQGSRVWDEEGNDYLDCLAGIAVNALGHAHPAVVDAVTHQVSQLGHVSNLAGSAPAVELAESLQSRIADATDAATGQATRVFFANSGAEANEAALKLARLSGKRRILTAEGGFHGRTMGTLTLTGQPTKQQKFRPLLSDVEYFPYGDIGYLTQLVEQAPDDTAAIMLEPVQGESGVIPAPTGFFTQVRALCDKHDILFIVDEVQTGVGRTGDFFAFEHEGIVPDIVTLAKGLGGGLPIGACLAIGEANRFEPGDHGTTFGGNPIACAAANAVLNELDPHMLVDVKYKSAKLIGALSTIRGVRAVRGRGLMLGVVLRTPVAAEVVSVAREHGLIVNAPAPDVIRLTPPLVISDEEITEAVSTLATVLWQLS
nr:acetylornithine transaminase [Corynebacterium incognita]